MLSCIFKTDDYNITYARQIVKNITFIKIHMQKLLIFCHLCSIIIIGIRCEPIP